MCNLWLETGTRMHAFAFTLCQVTFLVFAQHTSQLSKVGKKTPASSVNYISLLFPSYTSIIANNYFRELLVFEAEFHG